MTPSTLPDDLAIAPGYTVGCWKSLKLDPDVPDSVDWNRAIDIFEARIRRRFLDPVDELIRFEQGRSTRTFGFAILAIDFLVIEALQGFREGSVNHRSQNQKLFTTFLKHWSAFKDCLPPGGDPEQLSKRVWEGYRCELHHTGSTEGAFRVGVSGPTFDLKDKREFKINRTCLHEQLKREFEAYLVELRKPDGNDLRSNFIKKMKAICGL